MPSEQGDAVLQTARALVRALRDGRPLSLVRLGDGEALTLAQGVVLQPSEVRRRGPFLGYAGVKVPDLACRDRLARAVRTADIVGLTSSIGQNFAPLLARALAAHQIDLSGKIRTDAVINYQLHLRGHLAALLRERPLPRVLLVGRRARELDPVMRGEGVRIVGAVAPVNGCKDVGRVLDEMAGFDYDIALVSAGVAAVPLCAEGALRHRGLHLDLGHLADELITGAKRLDGRPE